MTDKWRWAPLDDLVDRVSRIPRPFEGFRPYLATANVDRGSYVVEKLVSFRDRPSRANLQLHVGDVLQAKMRESKKDLLVTEREEGWLASTGFVQLAADDVLADPRFVRHVVREEAFLRERDRLAVGTTQQAVSDRVFGNIKVPHPPINAQRSIARVLDTLDDTIRATDRLIAKLSVLRHGLIQELIPHPAPDSWKQGVLNDVVDVQRPIVYGILMPGEHVQGGIPVIKVKDIHGGTIRRRAELLHTHPSIHRMYLRSAVESGDLLFTIRGTVGRIAFVPDGLSGANITQDTARIAIKHAHPAFVAASIESQGFKGYESVHTIGQAVRGLNLRELRQAPLPLPPADHQALIGRAVELIGKRIRAERARLAGLHMVSSGLASDLLSGRVRTVVQ